MAAEGEFPKSPGDVIYASEYNSFFRVGNSHNLCSGLVPVTGGTWTSGPSALSNITDEDYQTSGTTGYNTGNTTGYIWIDLKSVAPHHTIMPYYTYMISGPGGYTAGTIAVAISGPNGITNLGGVSAQTYASGTGSATITLNITNNRFRYVGFYVDSTLSGKVWFTPFELMVF